MRKSILFLLCLLGLASEATSQIEKLPEFNSFRYGVMYYSIYDDINGYTLKGRVRPHYTMGVLDTIIIDSQTLPINEYVNKWRIRYEPNTLTPAYRVMEQWNSSWVRYQVDSFKYADGLRVERYTQFYDAGLPLHKERTFYVHDGERRLLTSTEEVWQNTIWVPKVKHGYFYNDFDYLVAINDSSKKGNLFHVWTRELWDYFDDKLDEVNREKNLFPNPIWMPTERFRYANVEKRDSSFLTISDTLLAFDTLVGATQSRFFTVTNPGEEAASVSRLSFIETGSFSLHGLPKTPFTIMPGASIQIEARYSPKSRLQELDSAIVFLDGVHLRPVLLSGISRQGVLRLARPTIDFGTVTVDSTKSIPIDVENIGDASVIIDSIRSSDPRFTITDVSGTVLAGSTWLAPYLTFAPVDSVYYETQLRIYYTDQLGPQDTTIIAFGNGFRKLDSVLSVDRNDLAAMISVSPNPASDQLRISANGVEVIGSYIMTIEGKRYDLPLQQVTSGVVSLDGIPSGAATLFLITKQGSFSSKLMIVR